jgi:predicted nucleic acid-binding Zn ribbon protein
MICTNCGAKIPDNSTTCEKCGAKIEAPETEEKTRNKALSAVLIIVFILGAVAAILLLNIRKNSPLHGAKLKKQIVWETEDLTVSVKGLKYDKENTENPYYIEMKAENKGSADKVVTCEAAAINDVKVDADFELNVPAGGEAEGRLTFTDRYLNTLDIFKTFSTVSLALRSDDQISGKVSMKTGLKKNKATLDKGDANHQYDENDVIVNYEALDVGYSGFGPAVVLYVENNSDEVIRARIGEAKVNGTVVECKTDDTGLLPHTAGYVQFIIDNEQLTSNNLLPLSKVSTKIEFYDPVTQETKFTAPILINNP